MPVFLWEKFEFRSTLRIRKILGAIAAETLGLEFENIHVTWADTQIAPEGGATSASRQTFITGNAVKNACTNAMGELKRTASEFLNVPQEELIFRHREIYSSKDESKKMTYPELMGAMGKNGRLAVGAFHQCRYSILFHTVRPSLFFL